MGSLEPDYPKEDKRVVSEGEWKSGIGGLVPRHLVD